MARGLVFNSYYYYVFVIILQFVCCFFIHTFLFQFFIAFRFLSIFCNRHDVIIIFIYLPLASELNSGPQLCGTYSHMGSND